MIVKCIKKSNDLGHSSKKDSDLVNLVIGKQYKVYALEIENKYIFVYLSDFEDSLYPSRYSLEYFEIVSNKLSKHWRLNIKEGVVQLLISDWIDFPDFMDIYFENFEPNPEIYGGLFSFIEYRRMLDREPG